MMYYTHILYSLQEFSPDLKFLIEMTGKYAIIYLQFCGHAH